MKNNQSKNKKGILETMYDTIMEKGGPTGPITQSLVDLWEKPLEPEEENKKTIIKFIKKIINKFGSEMVLGWLKMIKN